MHRPDARLAWFGLPLVAVFVVLAAISSPRPVREVSTPADPATSGPAALGAAAGASAVASAAAAAPAGFASTDPTARPGLAATSDPAVLPPTLEPTTSATTAPTAVPATGAPGTAAPTATSTTAPTAAPTQSPTSAPTAPAPSAGPPPALSSCAIFPSSNVWNRRVDGLPVAANSAAMVAAIGLGSSLHPDFSAAGGYGIPFNVVGAATPRSTVAFEYDDESDHVGYPIPGSPQIEGGSDRHLLMIDTDACVLYELFAASHSTSGWQAGSGAVWDLGSNALRPDGWTSADAAGLPIFPGLVRYSEVAAGAIRHAIRFTAPHTCNSYVFPARHEAGSGSCNVNPPMGLRVRLKASVDASAFGPQAQVILVALQQYGMLLADNGSPWYITGAPDSHWNDDELHDLGQLTGNDFEVVDTTGFVNG